MKINNLIFSGSSTEQAGPSQSSAYPSLKEGWETLPKEVVENSLLSFCDDEDLINLSRSMPGGIAAQARRVIHYQIRQWREVLNQHEFTRTCAQRLICQEGNNLPHLYQIFSARLQCMVSNYLSYYAALQFEGREPDREDFDEGVLAFARAARFEIRSGQLLEKSPQRVRVYQWLQEPCLEFLAKCTFHPHCPQELSCDPEIVVRTLKWGSVEGMFLQLPPAMQANREVAMEAVRLDGLMYEDLDPILQKDRQIALVALSQSAGVFRMLDASFKEDLNFLIEAELNRSNLKGALLGRPPVDQALALAMLQNSEAQPKELIELIQEDGFRIESVSQDLENYRELALVAVRSNGWVLRVLPSALREDPAIVEAAVRQDGQALEFASQALQANRTIVMAAVQQDGEALEWASEELQNDYEVGLAAVLQGGFHSNASFYLGDGLKDNRDIALAAVQKNGRALEEFPGFANDIEIVKFAVQQNGLALECAPDLQNSREIVIAAVSQNGEAIWLASEELRLDSEILHLALEQAPWLLHMVPAEERTEEQFWRMIESPPKADE